jgi:hypothetical protein
MRSSGVVDSRAVYRVRASDCAEREDELNQGQKSVQCTFTVGGCLFTSVVKWTCPEDKISV